MSKELRETIASNTSTRVSKKFEITRDLIRKKLVAAPGETLRDNRCWFYALPMGILHQPQGRPCECIPKISIL